MNQTQKDKRNFRNSKKWKELRHKKNVEQKGLCYITHKRLNKLSTLHHCNLDPTVYSNPKEEELVYLNYQMHKVVHWIFEYYKNDRAVLDRLKEVLDKMLVINGYIEIKEEDYPTEEEILTAEQLDDLR